MSLSVFLKGIKIPIDLGFYGAEFGFYNPVNLFSALQFHFEFCETILSFAISF